LCRSQSAAISEDLQSRVPGSRPFAHNPKQTIDTITSNRSFRRKIRFWKLRSSVNQPNARGQISSKRQQAINDVVGQWIFCEFSAHSRAMHNCLSCQGASEPRAKRKGL